MRIKKVDLFAKGLRSFATFTEAAVPGRLPAATRGRGSVAEVTKWSLCEPLQLLARARLLEDLAGPDAWIVLDRGNKKNPQHYLLWVQLKEKLFR